MQSVGEGELLSICLSSSSSSSLATAAPWSPSPSSSPHLLELTFCIASQSLSPLSTLRQGLCRGSGGGGHRTLLFLLLLHAIEYVNRTVAGSGSSSSHYLSFCRHWRHIGVRKKEGAAKERKENGCTICLDARLVAVLQAKLLLQCTVL